MIPSQAASVEKSDHAKRSGCKRAGRQPFEAPISRKGVPLHPTNRWPSISQFWISALSMRTPTSPPAIFGWVNDWFSRSCRVRETLDVGRELDTQMRERHGPNIGVQAFLTRTDLLSLVLLSGLWISMSALVNPIGDFPLNDDWVYAYGVRSIVQGGRFELPGTGAPDVIAQAYWGALFCMPFGFSFTALRFSTLTLGWAGLIAFYLLIQEVAGNRWLALLGGLALATNPIYFGLAHTFMTEVPFVSLVIIALWLFVRGLKRNASVPLLAGIVITLIAILVRQFALLLLLAFGVAYLVKNGVKWKTLAVAIIPLAFGAGVHVAYQHWMIVTGRKPYFELATLSDLIPIPFVTFILYSLRIPLSLPYLGFFLAPIFAS